MPLTNTFAVIPHMHCRSLQARTPAATTSSSDISVSSLNADTGTTKWSKRLGTDKNDAVYAIDTVRERCVLVNYTIL
jgi:hypothetical protein